MGEDNTGSAEIWGGNCNRLSEGGAAYKGGISYKVSNVESVMVSVETDNGREGAKPSIYNVSVSSGKGAGSMDEGSKNIVGGIAAVSKSNVNSCVPGDCGVEEEGKTGEGSNDKGDTRVDEGEAEEDSAFLFFEGTLLGFRFLVRIQVQSVYSDNKVYTYT